MRPSPGAPAPATLRIRAFVWDYIVLLAGGYLLGLSPLGRGRTLYDHLSGTGVQLAPENDPPVERRSP